MSINVVFSAPVYYAICPEFESGLIKFHSTFRGQSNEFEPCSGTKFCGSRVSLTNWQGPTLYKTPEPMFNKIGQSTVGHRS